MYGNEGRGCSLTSAVIGYCFPFRVVTRLREIETSWPIMGSSLTSAT